MTIDQNRLDDFAGIDEVVVNQRSRAVRPGTTYGINAASNGQFGTLWMVGTGVATNFAAGATPNTITAAMLGGGIVVQTPGQATTWNLDTAANVLTYMNNNSAGVQVGDILVCDVINASTVAANTITINFGTGGGFDTGQTQLVMAANSSRTLFVRITAIGASPAYIVYG